MFTSVSRELIELTQEQISISNEIVEKIKKRIMPIKYPDFILESLNFKLRKTFIEYMGYMLLSKMWIESLSIWIGSQKCLEIMAVIHDRPFLIR